MRRRLHRRRRDDGHVRCPHRRCSPPFVSGMRHLNAGAKGATSEEPDDATLTPRARRELAARGLLAALEVYVHEVLADGVAASEWIDQHASPLGKRGHLEAVRRGDLRGVKHGRRILVRRAELNSFPGGSFRKAPHRHRRLRPRSRFLNGRARWPPPFLRVSVSDSERDSSMPKPTGMVTWLSGEPYVRVRLPNSRPYFRIRGCATAADVQARATAVAQVIVSLKVARKESVIEEFARSLAEARTASELEGVRMAVRALCEGDVAARPKFDDAITFKQFAEKWYTGALHEAYPRQVKAKKTSDQDRQFLSKWVFPYIGDVPLLAVTIEHCEDVLNSVPQTKSDHLARHVAQVMRRTFALARYPVKLIKASPIPPGFVPTVRTKKARTYLYADEDLQLLGCTSIYLVLRLLYGVLGREGLRIDEALSLDFHDSDFEERHRSSRQEQDGRPTTLGPRPLGRRRAPTLEKTLPYEAGAERARLHLPLGEPRGWAASLERDAR